MTSYSRGDVILVDIAFSGASGSKRRPAVVISTSNFNSAGIKLIVAAVTGNVSPPFRPGDTLLKEWSAAGLVKPSAVRGVLATVDKSDVCAQTGCPVRLRFCRRRTRCRQSFRFRCLDAPQGLTPDESRCGMST